jgi:UDP-N-acetylglucosamine--N-acetylmuramyl-(pentapeptide) pyrophosphoryl-undecaprenol N-acetylglucosamine transferase
MRVVITGGGTGGHTSAGLAVAETLRSRGVELAWIGSRDGVEARRVPARGIDYHAVPAGKLRRYWDRRNVTDLLGRIPAGLFRSWRLLRGLRPDLLFATGGFVALPPVLAAWLLRIPVIVHEQVAVSGLANRIAARFARRVAITFPSSASEFPRWKSVLTGNPLRPELAGSSREAAVDRLGLEPTLPVVYVTGGAQGSHRINRALGEILEPLLTLTQLIHQCGDQPFTGDRAWLLERASRLDPTRRARYRLLPYVEQELREVYGAAWLVVGRAGAGTVNECCHLGLPALLIPLAGASGDEQTANARAMAAVDGALVLPEISLTPEGLLATIRSLLADPQRLKAMGDRARTLAVPDAAERIADLIQNEISHSRAGA